MPKARKTKLTFSTPDDIRAFRFQLGLNQAQFWSRIGVTQSGGSRYESGRNIPAPTQHLLTITYGTDAEVEAEIEFLRGWKRN